ncbi:MAG: MoaD/ThiS family protein [Candidatus Bipolaricaulota bacterium]
MNLEVRRYATLALDRSAAGAVENVELPDGSSVFTLLAELGVAPEAVHLVFVDGRACTDRSVPLRDGARVGLFPPVGGG